MCFLDIVLHHNISSIIAKLLPTKRKLSNLLNLYENIVRIKDQLMYIELNMPSCSQMNLDLSSEYLHGNLAIIWALIGYTPRFFSADWSRVTSWRKGNFPINFLNYISKINKNILEEGFKNQSSSRYFRSLMNIKWP